MKLNFAETPNDQGRPAAAPAGRYLVEITNVSQKPAGENAKNAGAPVMTVEFTVIEGDYANKKFFDNTTFAEHEDSINAGPIDPNAVWVKRLKALLGATGFDVSGEFDFEPTDESDLDKLMGSKLVVRVNKARDNMNSTPDETVYRNNVVAFFSPESEDGEGNLLP